MYTKEKFEYVPVGKYGNKHPIVQRGRSGGNCIQGSTPEQEEADARRLVALWNATLDIPTEALEAGVIDDMRIALRSLVRIEPGGLGMSYEQVAYFAEQILNKLGENSHG